MNHKEHLSVELDKHFRQFNVIQVTVQTQSSVSTDTTKDTTYPKAKIDSTPAKQVQNNVQSHELFNVSLSYQYTGEQ